MPRNFFVSLLLTLISLVCGCSERKTAIDRHAAAGSAKRSQPEPASSQQVEPQPQSNRGESRNADDPTRISFEPIETPLVVTKERWKKSMLHRAKDGALSVPWYLQSPIVTTAAAAWEVTLGGETEDFELTLGKLLVSPTIIADPVSSTARFSRWHGSVPITIQPNWDSLEELADETSQIVFEFRVTSDSNDSVVQITDVLPNNMIANQSYGADANLKIGLSSGGKWGPISNDSGAGASFWWKWDPQTVVVASGATGNKAFVLLRRKPDDTGWFGRVPIELALLAPKDMTDAKLTITPAIVFSETQKIDLDSCTANILFEN